LRENTGCRSGVFEQVEWKLLCLKINLETAFNPTGRMQSEKYISLRHKELWEKGVAVGVKDNAWAISL
jgi:phosphoribosyl-AMP cyclohydrolase